MDYIVTMFYGHTFFILGEKGKMFNEFGTAKAYKQRGSAINAAKKWEKKYPIAQTFVIELDEGESLELSHNVIESYIQGTSKVVYGL